MRKENLAGRYDHSDRPADVVGLGISSRTGPRWCIFFTKKMQQYFFSWSTISPRMGKKHLEDIFLVLLEGLADSTVELIESRCKGDQ